MSLITKSIKGTQDTLPADSYKVQYIEDTALEVAENFGFAEIRTPVFEHTELFQRGVGDTTDVVQKEMYTFLDKGGGPSRCARRGRPARCARFWSMGCITSRCRRSCAI